MYTCIHVYTYKSQPKINVYLEANKTDRYLKIYLTFQS